MIKLTDKEKTMLQVLINETDGTDLLAFDWIKNNKNLGMSIDSAKGVFGSLISKGFLNFDECTTNDLKRQGDDAGEVYQWSIPVNAEQQQFNGVEYTIETPDDLVKQLEEKA